MLRILSILLIALAIGCASQARKATPLGEQEVPIPPPTPTPPPAVLPRPTPPAVVAPLPKPEWISLSRWCEENKLSPPLVKFSTTETNLEIKSPAGTFVFDPPRRNARWNDLLLGVGFAPRFTNGHPYISTIDAEKVLQPLLFPESAPKRKTGGIVMIDAGHGGQNQGALSRDRKLMEKEMTLDWAKRIEKLLQGSQWKVILTRPVDVDLALTQRVAFAEQKQADLFISLHFNSFSNAKEAGLETYCFTPRGTASHLTRGYADEIANEFPNNRYDVENLLLAHDLHRALLKHTGRKDRGIRRARFMTVLREQNRPAVLLEGGYLSNPEEAKLIGSAEYRQKLAEAVAEALGVTPKTLTTLRQ